MNDEAGSTVKPEWLDERAGAEWNRLVTELEPVLSPSDRGILTCAADAYSQLVKASRVIQRSGATYTAKGETGSVLIKQHPAMRQREAARAAYARALAELGCSPVSRVRVKVAPVKPAPLTGLARLLN